MLEEQDQFVLLNLPDNYERGDLFRHGLEQCVDKNVYQKMSLSHSHAITRNQEIKLKEGDGEILLEMNDILTEYQKNNCLAFQPTDKVKAHI